MSDVITGVIILLVIYSVLYAVHWINVLVESKRPIDPYKENEKLKRQMKDLQKQALRASKSKPVDLESNRNKRLFG